MGRFLATPWRFLSLFALLSSSSAPGSASADEGTTEGSAAITEKKRSRWLTWAPFLLVGVAIAFNLWELRAELTSVANLNDSAMHFSMMRWAEHRIRGGHLPFDGWYPYLGLGVAWFHHYQSLPHIIGGYLAVLFGTDKVFNWVLYLLLSFWPLSVYWSARLLGWGRWTAGAAALGAPLLVSNPGYGYESGSYVWLGYGMWSQLWGMWLLPIALALSWRAVAHGKSYALAALATAMTIALHLLTGYLALLAMGVWVLVKPSEFRRRFARAFVVGLGSLLVAAWVLVPLVQDSKFSQLSQYMKGTFWYDSFGAKKVLGWLFSGQLFDNGRLPVVSILVAIGAAVCVARFKKDERARALLGFFALSLLLFFGRPTLGPLLRLLPGSGDLFLHRYIMGVHLGGILLAAVGGVFLVKALANGAGRLVSGLRSRRGLALVTATASAVVGVGLLWPAWVDRATYAAAARDGIAYQLAADQTTGAQLASIVSEAESHGPGRIYAGTSSDWGADYKVGAVPVFAALLTDEAENIGFGLRTTSLSSDIEVRFNESNPAEYPLFGIRYLILPPDHQPAVEATKLDEVGQFVLWQIQPAGYFQLVDAVGQVSADRTDLGRAMDSFLNSNLPAQGLYPTVAFAGAPAAPPTVTTVVPTGSAGSVTSEIVGPADGVFAANVTANRPAMLVLKETFDPRWAVFVDGVQVPPAMVAPSFVGVAVPAGAHSVEFVYHAYPYYELLWMLGVLTLLGLAIGQRNFPRPNSEPEVASSKPVRRPPVRARSNR